MRTAGINRRIDDLGRIVIPKEYRAAIGANYGDEMEILMVGDKVVIQKTRASCIFCGAEDDLRLYRGKPVCPRCTAALRGDDYDRTV